jgi:hypothetical protein
MECDPFRHSFKEHQVQRWENITQRNTFEPNYRSQSLAMCHSVRTCFNTRLINICNHNCTKLKGKAIPATGHEGP